MADRPSYQEIEARLALDDHTGVLELARRRLDVDPSDARARALADRSTEVLTQMYLGKLGGPQRRLRLAMPKDKLLWLSIDHRAGFLLALLEEPTTIEELLEICGMPLLDALQVVQGLVERKVIALDAP